MAERNGHRPKPARVVKSPEERVKRTSFILPNDGADFLRAQKNASGYITELIHREMKKKEIPPL